MLIALGDERRQEIVQRLIEAGGVLSVGEIADAIELSQPAVSHHLKILRDAGVLGVQRVGTTRRYSLEVDSGTLEPLTDMVHGITECLTEQAES
ncbi:helix-turn-helix transcriptional regulator [Nocardia sp. BMG51109]|uniref:ArsR/SmtB family transcription factor n=1 Tax=Nocardia sp. BMG51109 TaxID=1056816 RepID=UPI0018DDDC06|nr:metalloregulator ArsR/SmtB family transcription factor [Nocardia sp. BMG51109]